MLSKLQDLLPGFRKPGMAHMSLTLVGFMWVLPFLYYYHAYPLTTFYQEWLAAALGLAAISYLLNRQFWLQAEVPRIALLPLALMLLVLLQFALGKTGYFDQTLLFSLYMLWASLLMMLGYGLREKFGLALLFTCLAAFLLLGAELNALLGILQHYRWHTLLDGVVTAKNNIAVYGNLAQPNHYANYITLGLVSLGFLRQYLRSWQMLLLALPLLFVLVLSGSRSSWLYLLGLLLMAWLWQRRDVSCRYLLTYAWLLLLGFALMHWVVQLPWLAGSSGSITTMQRLFGAEGGGSIRVYLWHESWLIFKQFPFLGAGLGQFAWQHFQLGPILQDAHVTGLYNNAHNLLMQIGAEMGMAGLLVLVATLAMWLRAGMQIRLELHHWWAYSVLLVLLVHSMLEYPLWYAYFMGIAAILLGALERSSFRLQLRGLGRISVVAIFALGLITLLQLQQGYRKLERALAARPQTAGHKNASQQMHEGLLELYGKPLLQPYAEFFLSSWITVNGDELDEKIAMNDRAVKFIPVSHPAYRRAWLLAQAGRETEAREQLERALWSYPGDFAERKEELSVLADKDPAHFSALLEFAIRKNKEYSSAVSTK